MSERQTEERTPRLALLAFLAATLAVLGRMLSVRAWWLAPAVSVALAPLQPPRLPDRLRRFARLAAPSLAAALVLVGLLHTSYPVAPEATGRVLRLLGLVFLSGGVLVSLGARALPHGRVTVVTAVSALLAAALLARGGASGVGLAGLLSSPLLALVLYLLSSKRTVVSGRARGLMRRRLLRLAFSLTVAAVVTLGVARLLPWAQPHVEGLLADDASRARTGFGPRSRLGEIADLAQDHTVALRIWSSRPLYLRLRAAARFDGRQWDCTRWPARPTPVAPLADRGALPEWAERMPGATFPLSSAPEAGPRTAATRVLITTPLSSGTLAVPLDAVRLRAPLARVDLDAAHIVIAPRGQDLDVYWTLSAEGSPPVPLPDALRSACLELPPSLDPRLPSLATRLSAPGRAPAERLARTLAHLQQNYHYTLQPGPFRSRDPVAEFLFEKRCAYCEYFATSAVLLLRLEGVPTRYVQGFCVREAMREGDHYVVRLSDAHAWIEAWIDGQGWVEGDPTPAAEYDALHARRVGWWARAYESLHARLALLAASLRQGLRAGALTWARRTSIEALRFLFVRHPLATALALLALPALRRLRGAHLLTRLGRRPAADASFGLPPLLRQLGRRLDRLLARRGFPRPPARPPLEHLASLPAASIDQELRAAADEIVRALYSALYAGTRPTRTDLDALALRLARLEHIGRAGRSLPSRN